MGIMRKSVAYKLETTQQLTLSIWRQQQSAAPMKAGSALGV